MDPRGVQNLGPSFRPLLVMLWDLSHCEVARKMQISEQIFSLYAQFNPHPPCERDDVRSCTENRNLLFTSFEYSRVKDSQSETLGVPLSCYASSMEFSVLAFISVLTDSFRGEIVKQRPASCHSGLISETFPLGPVDSWSAQCYPLIS